jgi:hypothetical protein
MPDIVKILRGFADNQSGPSLPICDEAADEIERLRDIIRRRLECDGSNGTYDAAKNLELTIEMYDATRRI